MSQGVNDMKINVMSERMDLCFQNAPECHDATLVSVMTLLDNGTLNQNEDQSKDDVLRSRGHGVRGRVKVKCRT